MPRQFPPLLDCSLFHFLTTQQLVAGGVGVYVIEPFVIGWKSFGAASIRPLIRIAFVTTTTLTCGQEMYLELLRIVFAMMSLVTS